LNHSYPCNNYNVVTTDGYVLSLQNIPYGRLGPSSEPRYPVLLQHGLLDSAAVRALATDDPCAARSLLHSLAIDWIDSIRMMLLVGLV